MTAIHSTKRVLVLGATGMLGNAVLRPVRPKPKVRFFGSVRSSAARRLTGDLDKGPPLMRN